jgi:hypothetical protein
MFLEKWIIQSKLKIRNKKLSTSKKTLALSILKSKKDYRKIAKIEILKQEKLTKNILIIGKEAMVRKM